MRRKGFKTYGWLLLFILGSCIDPYQPPAITDPASHLVVDGFLDTGVGSARIRLTRTQNLADTKQPRPELKAQLSLEGGQSRSFSFQEEGLGYYTLSGLAVKPGEQYRLRIKTAGGTQYLSESAPVLETPEIDSLSWERKPDGVQIYVTTHDPRNATRYYRWEYEDTWEFISAFNSLFEIKNGQATYRQDDIYRCWAHNKSKNIFIGSSTKLTQDVMYKHPILFIRGENIRLGIKYSVLIKQYGLSRQEYEYWQQLEKMTESMGSLFDPQPSQVTGNIRNTADSDEVVFGYFGIHSVKEKRLFIRRTDIPNWSTVNSYTSCVAETLSLGEVIRRGNLIVTEHYLPSGARLYISSSPHCVDCRFNGTNVKPSFWE